MENCLYFTITFVLGTYISIHELHINNPLIRFAFSRSSWWLWLYGAIYGLICIGILYFFVPGFGYTLDHNSGDSLSLPGSYPVIIYAILIGICTKSVLAVSLVSVPFEGKAFSLGPSTILKVFEPALVNKIDDDNFIEMNKFIDSAIARNANLNITQIHQSMRSNLSTRGQTAEVSAFLMDLSQTTEIRDAFAMYIKVWGVKIFKHTFLR